MENRYCLFCKKEYNFYRATKPVKLKTGYKIYFRKKESKFCSKNCYHSNAKGKPLTGERLKQAQKTILKVINLRENIPKNKEKWILKNKQGALLRTGPKNSNWIHDRSKISNQSGRNCYEDLRWKKSVYKRDLYQCRIGNKDCKGRIEAHHILSWRDYPELRYQINNGITLCHAHHPIKRSEEKRLSPYFQELVSVSKE